MKIKGILLATISVIGISGALAQGVEYDDMYFNAEDRAKLNAQRSTDVAFNSTPRKSNRAEEYYDRNPNVNPTDSYSARNVNPEYTSRANSQLAQEDNEDYFVSNYQYNRNQLNNWNNDFNNWYNNSWYRPNFYGPGINTWNSPYYGYSAWNSPWYDPFWAYNGWSSSFSFHYGNTWNYGWGGRYNYWNRPYFGWDPYGMAYGYMGYGLGYGGGYWNNYRYPTVVVVNNGERVGRGVVYGKRPTRSSSIVSDRNTVRSRSNVSNPVRNDNSSGRMSATQSRKQADYYNRYRTQQRTSAPTYDSRSNTQYNRSRSWDNSSRSSWDTNRSMNRSSSPSYSSPSRSSSAGSSSGSTGGRRGRD